jgi:hypothetical protein
MFTVTRSGGLALPATSPMSRHRGARGEPSRRPDRGVRRGRHHSGRSRRRAPGLLRVGPRWGWAGAQLSEWSPYGERCYRPADPARELRWGRCAVRVTGHINRDARPLRDRCRGAARPGPGGMRRRPAVPAARRQVWCAPRGFAYEHSSRDRLITGWLARPLAPLGSAGPSPCA